MRCASRASRARAACVVVLAGGVYGGARRAQGASATGSMRSIPAMPARSARVEDGALRRFRDWPPARTRPAARSLAGRSGALAAGRDRDQPCRRRRGIVGALVAQGVRGIVVAGTGNGTLHRARGGARRCGGARGARDSCDALRGRLGHRRRRALSRRRGADAGAGARRVDARADGRAGVAPAASGAASLCSEPLLWPAVRAARRWRTAAPSAECLPDGVARSRRNAVRAPSGRRSWRAPPSANASASGSAAAPTC